MRRKAFALTIFAAMFLAVGAWKWSAPHHRVAGWTWDDSAQPSWVDD